MNRVKVILILASLALSGLLLFWGVSLKEDALELTEHQISMSAPEDILGFGYWLTWSFFLIAQLAILFLSGSKRSIGSVKYFSLILLCAVAFATATISSYDEYLVLEKKVFS